MNETVSQKDNATNGSAAAHPAKREQIEVSARIGRTGVKIHPALAVKTERQFGGRTLAGYEVLYFRCSCGGTANGHAAHKATVVCEGTDKTNCGTSGHN